MFKKTNKEPLTINEFGKQRLIDYEFYKKLGYTDNQSITLAAFAFMPWNSSSAEAIAIKMLKTEYHAKKRKESFSDFFVENFKSTYVKAQKEAAEEEKLFRQTAIPMGMIQKIVLLIIAWPHQ